LMSLVPHQRPDIAAEVDDGRFYGSVFSDGSLLGEIRLPRVHRRWINRIEVEL
jgi:hypothetical protein